MPSQLEINLKFQLKCNGIEAPKTEYRFHPTRRWRFDFAWPDIMLAVECEGGNWTGGRHTTGTGFEADCEKYNEAVLAGWSVLRFTGDQVKSGYALVMIERFFLLADINRDA